MKVTYSEHTYYSEKISENPILIDLGACLGDFSKHFLQNYPNANIILLEPSKSNFSKIILDSNNVKKIFGAIAPESGKELTFFEDPNSTQNGSLLFNYFNGISYNVNTFSLDDLIKDFDAIDLIKMDIEGAEWDCIMNMKDATMNKIQQLTVEFHDFLDPSLSYKTNLAVNKLLDNGFKLEHNSTTYMYGSKYYDSLFYK